MLTVRLRKLRRQAGRPLSVISTLALCIVLLAHAAPSVRVPSARMKSGHVPVSRSDTTSALPVQCPDPLLGVADLGCTELFPTPDLPGTSAVLELQRVPSPFNVSVTADGHPRQHLLATVAGLPAARTLGNYSVYVAWAYTLALDSPIKLGVVHNGRSDLGEVDYNQFRILVSAERSSEVTHRTGRLVLRGTSPSARLMAHRDLFTPATLGAPSMSSAMQAMPGMTHAPAREFRPGMIADAGTLQRARPSEPVDLHDGDTLSLAAGLVQRTILGRTFAMYAFNGRYPGPLLRVDQGATIVVRFHNDIDLPGALHWHGVRLDNRFDGVPGVTQVLVARGGGLTYRVHFPDAGIYWYHPHHREDIEQDMGLYGNILVRSHDPDYYGHVNAEKALMLDDIVLDARGPAPYGTDTATHALMGRFGNVFLVNGEPHYRTEVRRGDVVRFQLTNASNARTFNVSFGAARMKLVASDAGKLEREAWVASVVIAPAERYVIDVAFEKPGSVALVNRVQALDHRFGTFSSETDTLGTIEVSEGAAAPSHAETFAKLRHNADVAHDIDRFRPFFDKKVDHTIALTLRTHDLPPLLSAMLTGINTPVDWNDGMPMMNAGTTASEVTWVLRDADSGRENMDIAWNFAQGDVVKLRFINDPSASHAMAHPIHLHGQRFLVLNRNGVRNDNLVWKDTALIPAGDTVDLLVDMSNPGQWMMHCHVAEHLGSGMMSVFTVARKH